VHLRRIKLIPSIITATVVSIVAYIHLLPRLDDSGRFDFLMRWEWDTYDWRVESSFKNPNTVANNLGAVFIDDESIQKINEEFGYEWRWPRYFHGLVVQELAAQGATAVGFDIFFAETSDITVPAIDGDEILSDVYFAEKIREAGNVYLASRDGLSPAPLFLSGAAGVGDITADSDSDGVLRRARPFKTYRSWHPILAAAANEFGIILDKAEIKDGVLSLPRLEGDPIPIPVNAKQEFNLTEVTGAEPAPGESPWKKCYVEERAWHLGVHLAARALGIHLNEAVIADDQIVMKTEDGDIRFIPLDTDGFFHINWMLKWNDGRLVQQSFYDVMESARKRAAGEPVLPSYKDKLVFIGSIGSGNNISDFGSTPLSPDTYLVSKHWNVANAIVSDQMVSRTSISTEIIIIFVLGFCSYLLTWEMRAPLSSISVAALGGVYIYGAFSAYANSRLWMPVIFPVVGALFFNHIIMVCYQVIFEQSEKKRVKGVFSKLVSPNVVQELLSSDKMNLGGSRKNITVLFSDVRGFTSMTDEYQKRAVEYVEKNGLTGDEAEAYYDQQAQETLATVNVYLGTISNMVKKHNGTLDKYMGDCVMAFWGAPTPNEQHALSCVKAAVDAQRAMYRLNLERAEENKRREAENEERLKRGEEPLPIMKLLSLGSGINSGISIVGLMGSSEHILNFTVFGREVNLASRLEHVSGRGRIVIGEATYHEIVKFDPEYAKTFRELEPVMVKGIANAVRIFEVPWKEGMAEEGQLEAMGGSMEKK